MDAKIRELKRRAATGDIDAARQLRQIWIRLGLIPSDSDLLQMRCGFAVGGEEAILPAIRIWQHLLGTLLETVRRIWRSHIIDYAAQEDTDPNANGLLDEVEQDLQEYLSGINALPTIIERWLTTDPEDMDEIEALQIGSYTGFTGENMLDVLHDALQTALGEPHRGLNYHLDLHADKPPIYLHYNELTRSLRISYINPEDNWGLAVQEGVSMNRSPKKLDTTIRRIGDEWQVCLNWNVGDRFDYDSAEYIIPTTLDALCMPFFSRLPCSLQDEPGIWHEWGWGDCNLEIRTFGNWDYNPIKQELGSMHWLYPEGIR